MAVGGRNRLRLVLELRQEKERDRGTEDDWLADKHPNFARILRKDKSERSDEENREVLKGRLSFL